MLVSNNHNYQVGEVVGFKMVSGDEIVGKLVTADAGRYELNKPCIVITSENGIGLMQAMFSLDPDAENLTIKEEHVITKCRVHARMHEHYLKVTTSQE
jgi:hypothetical protein